LQVSEQELERLIAELWGLDTLGVEVQDGNSGNRRVLAYFRKVAGFDWAECLDGLAGIDSLYLIESTTIGTEDWLAPYRLRVQPFAVGTGWWIDPREPGASIVRPPKGRRLLRIPARTAFGTGSHASTALVVEMLETLTVAGKRVLDVGTGTGILGIVASLLGASEVLAFDSDLQACLVALQTCRINGVDLQIFAGDIHVLDRELRPRFDLVLANVLPQNLHADLAEIVAWLEPFGTLLLSGLLTEQAQQLERSVADLGLEVQSRKRSDAWSLLEVVRGEN